MNALLASLHFEAFMPGVEIVGDKEHVNELHILVEGRVEVGARASWLAWAAVRLLPLCVGLIPLVTHVRGWELRLAPTSCPGRTGQLRPPLCPAMAHSWCRSATAA
jgi:hypothetical protein